MASNYSELVVEFDNGTQLDNFTAEPSDEGTTQQAFKDEASRIKTAASAIALAAQQEATQIISTQVEEGERQAALELMTEGMNGVNEEVAKITTATDNILNDTVEISTWPTEIQSALATMDVIKTKTKEVLDLATAAAPSEEGGPEEEGPSVPEPDFEPQVEVPEDHKEKEDALKDIASGEGGLEAEDVSPLVAYETELLRIKKIARLYAAEAQEKAKESITTSTLSGTDQRDQLARVTENYGKIEIHLNRIDEIYLGVHDTTTEEKDYVKVLNEARKEVEEVISKTYDMVLEANISILDFDKAFLDLVKTAQAFADTKKSEAQQIIVTAPEVNDGEKTEEFRKIDASYNLAINNIHSIEALKNANQQADTLTEKIANYKDALEIYTELTNTMGGAINLAKKFAGLKEEELEFPVDPEYPAIKEEDIDNPDNPPHKEDWKDPKEDEEDRPIPPSELTEEEVADQEAAYDWVDRVLKSEDYSAYEKIVIIREKDTAPFNALIKRLDAYQNVMSLDKVVDPLKGARANFDLYTYLTKQLKQNYAICKPVLDLVCIYFAETDRFSAFRHTALTRFDLQWEFGRDTLKEFQQLVTIISILADLKERSKNRRRVSLVGSAIDRTIIDNITRYFEL